MTNNKTYEHFMPVQIIDGQPEWSPYALYWPTFAEAETQASRLEKSTGIPHMVYVQKIPAWRPAEALHTD